MEKTHEKQMIDKILLVPTKLDEERDNLANAWTALGGKVLRIDTFWIRPDVGTSEVALYGNETFCLVLSQVLEKTLVTVKDEIIVELDNVWTKRELKMKTIGDCLSGGFPKFIKSVVPKVIKARVYNSSLEFTSAVGQYDPAERVIESDIIDIQAEVRVFVLDKVVLDMAFYEGHGNLEGAKAFALNFLTNSGIPLPRTFVMDLGFNEIAGWFVVEFNSTWGAGLNGCDPYKVAPCIAKATID